MYKFAIRDVLWLMVVIALLATRWVDSRAHQSEKAAAVKRQAAAETKYGDLLSKHNELKWHYTKWLAEGKKKADEDRRLTEVP